METPILFLIFNRPENTKKVFESISKAKPKQLFIAADGPREEKPGESELCKEVRKITAQIDWPCEVKTLFREKNLGCKIAVSSAIDWFFENVEQGIILEDDCLPNESFFGFCEKMLELYKDDSRIMMISGTNPVIELPTLEQTYFFSRYYSIWGWATWKRAWKLYDRNMKLWPSFKKNNSLKNIYPNRLIRNYFTQGFDQTYNGILDTWDFQWTYSCIAENGFTIIPKNNLISNLGEFGTHTSSKGGKNEALFMKTKELDLTEIKHPKQIINTPHLDKIIFEKTGITKITMRQILIGVLIKIGIFKTFQKMYNNIIKK